MKVRFLDPTPDNVELFKRDRTKFVPKESGCYVLTNFLEDILYIGLASDLQRRMAQHLDDYRKTIESPEGRSVKFFWHLCSNTHKVERTWQNTYVLQHARLPVFNKINSPVFS